MIFNFMAIGVLVGITLIGLIKVASVLVWLIKDIILRLKVRNLKTWLGVGNTVSFYSEKYGALNGTIVEVMQFYVLIRPHNKALCNQTIRIDDILSFTKFDNTNILLVVKELEKI